MTMPQRRADSKQRLDRRTEIAQRRSSLAPKPLKALHNVEAESSL